MHTHYKRLTFMAMVVMTTVLTMITMFAPLLVNQTSSSAFAITATEMHQSMYKLEEEMGLLH